jgi:hypothetical protein
MLTFLTCGGLWDDKTLAAITSFIYDAPKVESMWMSQFRQFD